MGDQRTAFLNSSTTQSYLSCSTPVFPGLSQASSTHLSPGSPDSRYIRVETCMFMIKLPQYSSLEIMLDKLRYAIHYREDPLSG